MTDAIPCRDSIRLTCQTIQKWYIQQQVAVQWGLWALIHCQETFVG